MFLKNWYEDKIQIIIVSIKIWILVDIKFHNI